MKILFIGDVFGRPGRDALKKVLPDLKAREAIDLVIANAENIHHGKGVSEEKLKEIMNCGVDFCTSGNHVFKLQEFYQYLNKADAKVIRPANYPEGVPGKGFAEIKSADGKKVLVINVMGRVFMHQHLDCPFRSVEKILHEKKVKLGKNFKAVVVDFHAEAGSEKIAMGYFLDGKVSAVVGTHTHVPTADERVLEHGTAFQSDLGLTGPLDGVIGVDKNVILEQYLTQMPVKHEIAQGKKVFNALLVETDDKNGLAKCVKRIQQIID